MLLGGGRVCFPFYASCLVLNDFIKGKISCSGSKSPHLLSLSLRIEVAQSSFCCVGFFLVIGVSSMV